MCCSRLARRMRAATSGEDDDGGSDRQERRADRAADEHERIAEADNQALPQVLLEHAADDERQQERSNIVSRLAQAVAQDCRIRSWRTRRTWRCSGCRRRSRKTRRSAATGSLAGTRSSETNNPTSGMFSTTSMTLPTSMLAMTPQNSWGCSDDQLWPGGHAGHQQRAHDDADHGIGRNAKTQERNEARLRRGIVGGFRSREAGDRALAEQFRLPRDLSFHHVAGKAREHRSAARQQTEEETKHAAARRGPGGCHCSRPGSEATPTALAGS